MKTADKVKKLTLSAVFAAIILVVTAYVPHIPIPGTTGYVHLGDTFIYLAACFLPTPYAIAAASIGAGLADTLVGAYLYIIPTILIKALMAAWFCDTGTKILSARNCFGTIMAAVILVGGYYLAAVLIVGNFVSPIAATMPWNAIQALVNTVLFFVLGALMDKMHLKEKVMGNR